MMDDTHIPDGIAVKLLLAGIVVTASVVGGLGLAHVTSQTDSATGSEEFGSESQLAFPINNATWTQMAFPINNVTAHQQSAGLQMALAVPGQDMDPY